MRNLKWTPEELKLTLELYLEKDIQWHSRISDSTWEICALSELLRGLDVIKTEKSMSFRSPSSIRLKLANFKSIDDRYNYSGMSNIGNLDREIWNQYHNDYLLLKEDCKTIVESHYKGEMTESISKYLLRYSNCKESNNTIEIYADKLIEIAKELRVKAVTIEDMDFSQKIIDECYSIIREISTVNNKVSKTLNDKNIKTNHAGINQREIHNDKIGKYVKKTMERLIQENKLHEDMINDMLDRKWSKDILHLGHPFMVKITDDNDLNSQIIDENGYVRYWKEVFEINNQRYCFCKEWYEPQRKYFEAWLNEIDNKLNLDITSEKLLSLLLKLKRLDEKKVYIDTVELKETIQNLDNLQNILDQLVYLKVLSRFQGSSSKLVVDDYDLLYKMLENPKNYVKEK